MLVLSRKVGQRIVIGDNIVITVVGQKGGGVRLGIDAPAEVPVHREEIHRQIQRQDTSVTTAELPDVVFLKH